MADNVVSVLLRLEQLRQFTSGTKQASDAIAKVGTEAERSGKKARTGWTGLAKWAGGAAAIYGGYRFLKGAATATEELGRSTLALTRTTGMDTKSASEWAGVLKSRGVQTNMFQRGLVQLSKEIMKTKTTGGIGKTALEQLGLSAGDAAIQGGNVQKVLMEVSDALTNTTNPAKRAALAQKLLGRQAIQLAPLFFRGSAAIKEQMDMQEKYGNVLTGKNQDAIVTELKHQRELKVAYQGMQVQLGLALLPAMLAVTKAITGITSALAPFLKNTKLVVAALGVFVTLLVALKLAMFLATVADTLFNVELGITGTLLTLGLLPAIILLIAGVVLLIKHWGWVKDKFAEVFNWLKTHWPYLLPLLLGPIGIAAAAIITHWSQIKKSTTDLVNWVIKQFNRVVAFIKGIPGRIGHPFAKAFGGVQGAAHHAFGWAGLAEGGSLTTSGGVVVGERGPELLRLPAGARVTPLTGASPSPAAAAAGGAGDATITTQVFLDKREIARAVGQYTADRSARR